MASVCPHLTTVNGQVARRHRIWEMFYNSAIDTECTFINILIFISNSFYHLLRIYSIIARKYYLKQKKYIFVSDHGWQLDEVEL